MQLVTFLYIDQEYIYYYMHSEFLPVLFLAKVNVPSREYYLNRYEPFQPRRFEAEPTVKRFLISPRISNFLSNPATTDTHTHTTKYLCVCVWSFAVSSSAHNSLSNLQQ